MLVPERDLPGVRPLEQSQVLLFFNISSILSFENESLKPIGLYGQMIHIVCAPVFSLQKVWMGP